MCKQTIQFWNLWQQYFFEETGKLETTMLEQHRVIKSFKTQMILNPDKIIGKIPWEGIKVFLKIPFFMWVLKPQFKGGCLVSKMLAFLAFLL